MKWELLDEGRYVTTDWSGGTTTQLAIAPAGAVYADRHFLWRLSSARVELIESDFTPLPGYDRYLSVLEGALLMQIGEAKSFVLDTHRVCAFDGGTPVHAQGQCTDFNLMLRRGECEGTVQALALAPRASLSLTAALPATAQFPSTMLAFYCAQGAAALPDVGQKIQMGELLLCHEPGLSPTRLESTEGAVLMVVSIHSR